MADSNGIIIPGDDRGQEIFDTAPATPMKFRDEDGSVVSALSVAQSDGNAGIIVPASERGQQIYDQAPAIPMKFRDEDGSVVNFLRVEQNGGGGGIPDAPIDSHLYGRMNAEWKEISVMRDRRFGVGVPVGSGQVLQFRAPLSWYQSYNATWPLYVELNEYSMQYDSQGSTSFYLAMMIVLNFNTANNTVYAACDVVGHIPGNSNGIQITDPRVDPAIISNTLAFNIRDISCATSGRQIQMYIRAMNEYPFGDYSGATISIA